MLLRASAKQVLGWLLKEGNSHLDFTKVMAYGKEWIQDLPGWPK